jgi:hypothetical protein
MTEQEILEILQEVINQSPHLNSITDCVAIMGVLMGVSETKLKELSWGETELKANVEIENWGAYYG